MTETSKKSVKSEPILLIIDVQTAFAKAIEDFKKLVGRISLAAKAFGELGIQAIVTEQYPKGLGHTAEEILATLPLNTPIIEKTEFSAFEKIKEILNERKTAEVIICGIEAHICVYQTASSLFNDGKKITILADCVSSRSDVDKSIALERMRSSGIVISTLEMSLFEKMGDCLHPKFREIQKLIK
jgi:nicotinamidase-related amidase